LKKLSNLARKHPQHVFVLVIDELNRGNVAKIFGELFFLMEYRDRSIQLQYSSSLTNSSDVSNSHFVLPPNLWIIATMNTLDRSLTKLDQALRRRFFFVPFLIDKEPVQSLLIHWLRRFKPDLEFVDTVVKRANGIISKFDHSALIGPSHFMTSLLSRKWLKIIWKYSIVPNLEEIIDDDEQLRDLEALADKYCDEFE